MDVFSKLDFEGLTESVLGRRGCSGKAFSHGNILCSLFSSYLCGGDCLEDINALVGQFWQRPDTLFPQLGFHRGHHRRGWEPWRKHQREVPSGGHAPAHHAPRNLGAWRGDSPFPCRLRLVLKGNRPNRRQAGWKPSSCFCQRAGKMGSNREAERSEPIYEQGVLRRDIPWMNGISLCLSCSPLVWVGDFMPRQDLESPKSSSYKCIEPQKTSQYTKI